MNSIINNTTKTKLIKLTPILSATAILLGTLSLTANLLFAATGITSGSVISIKLTDGTDYKLVVTNLKDDNYTLLIGLDNACTIPGVACVNRDGLASSTGTVYNASPLSYTNSLTSEGGEAQTITAQTANFYNLLPENFQYAANIRSTNWSMSSVARSTDPTTTEGACSVSGNGSGVGSTNSANCTYTAPVFLASYEEWQGGLSGYIEEPAAGSVGDIWCKARYGTDDCKTTEIYKHLNFPWLRTADADTTERAWSLRGMTGYSVNLDLAFSEGGLLPAMYVNLSNLAVESGDGTYASPYAVVAAAPVDEEEEGEQNPGKNDPGTNPGGAPGVPKTGAVQGQSGAGSNGKAASVVASVGLVGVGVVGVVAVGLLRWKRMKI